MLSSVIFAGVGVLGAGYSLIVSAVAINHGPKCVVSVNGSNEEWSTPFSNGWDSSEVKNKASAVDGFCFYMQLFILFRDYLSNTTTWSSCLKPEGVVSWHLSLFSVLLVMALFQIALCAVQVVNGLLGAICGDCCGCCGGVSAGWDTSLQ